MAEFDPDAYLKSKPFDPDAYLKSGGQAKLGAADTAADVAKSLPTGIAKGTIGIAGLPGDLQPLVDKAQEWVAGKVPEGWAVPKSEQSRLPFTAPTSADIQHGIENYTGKFYEPKTALGKGAQTIGEFAPAMIGGGGSLVGRALTRAVLPGAASEAAGQATEGTKYEPWARVGAALLSPAAVSGARRAITPLPATAERTALANALRGEGVELTAGQATGSKPLQWAESTFGDMPGSGGRAAEIQTRQGEQFTNAALRRTGETANRASPEVIDGAFNRIGGQFDRIASRNSMAADAQLGNDLHAVESQYNALVGPNNRAPAIAGHIQDIADQAVRNGGHITGEQYNALTSQIARQARGAKNDPQLQEGLSGIRNALDDAFERSLRASGNTADLAALRDARNQYRNLMVIEKAATGAGAQTAEGIISPSQLRNAVVGQNRRSYARGNGDFADLARSGEAIMKPLPNSGTAPREFMQHAMSAIGAGLGGTAGMAAGPAGGFAGAVAGLAAPGAFGRALMSRPAQSYLANQLLPAGAPGNNRGQALARVLLAGQGGRDQQQLGR